MTKQEVVPSKYKCRKVTEIDNGYVDSPRLFVAELSLMHAARIGVDGTITVTSENTCPVELGKEYLVHLTAVEPEEEE